MFRVSLNEKLIDKVDGSYAVRRIGAILIAKRLESFPDLERKRTRIVVYNGNSKLDTKLDRRGVRGYAVGFQGIINFIASQLPQNEVMEGALRKEMKLIPEVALR